MAEQLTLKDTFKDWQEKINAMAAEVNDIQVEIDGIEDTMAEPGSFGFNQPASSGLVVRIFGGKVRDGSLIETLADADITLAADSTNVVCIYKRTGNPAYMTVYTLDNLPEEFVIPVGKFVTSATAVTAYEDLRTQYNTASGSAGSAAGVLQFDKLIERDMEVPSNRNALSISPIVADGVTVTINDTSTWVVL